MQALQEMKTEQEARAAAAVMEKSERNREAEETNKKLEKKDRVIYIYVGKPTQEYQSVYGTEPKIQLNDKFASVSEVGSYILAERAKKPQELQNVLTTALKVDKDANMGLISDIKQELRQVNALKVNYTTYDGDAFNNLQ